MGLEQGDQGLGSGVGHEGMRSGQADKGVGSRIERYETIGLGHEARME